MPSASRHLWLVSAAGLLVLFTLCQEGLNLHNLLSAVIPSGQKGMCVLRRRCSAGFVLTVIFRSGRCAARTGRQAATRRPIIGRWLLLVALREPPGTAVRLSPPPAGLVRENPRRRRLSWR